MAAHASESNALIQLVSREVFMPSPNAGSGTQATSYYTRNAGLSLISFHHYISRSDIFDDGCLRASDDNGRHWSAPGTWPTKFAHPLGTGRRDIRVGYVDPKTDRFILLWNEAVLRDDHPTQAMLTGTIHYQITGDGGKSWSPPRQVIHQGAGYDAEHHLPGVTFGKNCVMFGDYTDRPLTRADGAILVPVQSSPVGANGEYESHGSYTYTECLLLIGQWTADGDLAWTTSERVLADPARSSRGWIEPAIAELADGSLLMVMRGSNDNCPHLPGYRWAVRSHDGGQSWGAVTPWTYDDGAAFYSPSSCSQLIPYSDGRLFWVGNISPHNPTGNCPRYPLVIGEVDRASGLLLRNTVTPIDDRQPGESEHLTLSNFYVREDRETGDLMLHLTRFFAQDFTPGWPANWTSDALLYRLAVKKK